MFKTKMLIDEKNTRQCFPVGEGIFYVKICSLAEADLRYFEHLCRRAKYCLKL